VTVDTKAIERVITIAARPETVFRLLTDAEEYVRWKGERARLDPRPGGTYRVEFPPGKGNAEGRYVEVIPSRRVVFTWGWEGSDVLPPGASTVEIDLEPDGDGTRLRLVHRGLPEGEVKGHAEGWDYFLGRLANVAAGRLADAGMAQETSTKTQ
jgi:uncharacterized protein YndB with AHSA1/START domain